MPELEADFIISNNNALEAEYSIDESEHFDCSFELYASGTTWGYIDGNIENQTDLIERLNQKADNSTVEELSETVDSNYNTLDSKIDSTETALENEISALETDLNGKINEEQSVRIEADNTLQGNINTLDGKIDTHIADKTNPHEVTKTQVGLGNVDNTSDLNKPISTATQTALNGKQNTISDLSTIRTNASNGQSAYNTIQTYGDIVTYDASYFATSIQGQKADTALQPNDDISELNNDAGYITSASLPTVNNSTITFQKNNVTVGDFNLNQPNNETININVPTQASDVNALPDTTTIEDLTTTAQQNAINSGATSDNIGQIATNTSNLNSLQTTVTNNYNTLDGRITSEVSALNTAITTENTQRQAADSALQSQIDAIVSSSDVFDIVGTYAELQAYDISTVPVNDIIKVLVDSTHSNAATYYRCVETGGVKSWSYIGSEGAYYTKSESDSLFVEQTTTVNNKPLSNNITLTASDVGALPSSTTIGNGILTIQNNSVDVDTFGANATSNKTINIVTPTKTSDLTNDSGFIDSSGLSNYATQTDLTNGLATKQDTISDLSTIRSNATNGQSAYTTIGGYGDIVTYNASNFATSAQGDLADTALQQGDNISLLNNNAGYITSITSSDVTTALGYTPYNSTNPNGYTSNVGTVTSVNNTQPDANGNVTISVSGGANTDLSNLTATGEAHFQEPLVSGTNIKTINGASLLGSGNLNVGKNIGEIVTSTIPLTDAGLHLLDGTLLQYGSYQAFIDYINDIYQGTTTITYYAWESTNSSIYDGYVYTMTLNVSENARLFSYIDGKMVQIDIAYATSIDSSTILCHRINGVDNVTATRSATEDVNIETYIQSYFTSEADWQASVSAYGSCGKFVYDSTNNTVRLPKITGFTEGTIDPASLGDLTEAGLPNIEGSTKFGIGSSIVGTTTENAFVSSTKQTLSYSCSSGSGGNVFSFDASNFDTIYGNSTTVQPQSIKVLYYIVLANSTKTEIEVDIDEIATDLNGKADKDLQNINSNIVSIPPTSLLNFDGQWVGKYLSVSTATKVASRSHDLSAYLPNDNYSYEVLVDGIINYGSAQSRITVGTVSSPATNATQDGNFVVRGHASTNSRAQYFGGVIPLNNASRTLYSQITDGAAGSVGISLHGYRRIGTNS